jgi:hypothetical protein
MRRQMRFFEKTFFKIEDTKSSLSEVILVLSGRSNNFRRATTEEVYFWKQKIVIPKKK